MQTVALVTYRRGPELSASDSLLVAPLNERGIEVVAAPWDDETVSWEQFGAVVLRSCWDYHYHPNEFRRWLRRLESSSVRLWNRSPLTCWNIDKIYLRDLAARSVTTIPTIYLDPGEPVDLAGLLAPTAWDYVVIKPRIGASGYATTLIARVDAEAYQAQFDALLAADGALVQPLMPQIAEGEWSLVFFRGEFSHAIIKLPPAGTIFMQQRHGSTVRHMQPPAGLIAEAADVLRIATEVADPAGGLPLYARVDGLMIGGHLALMELEVIEPGLFLDSDPLAASRFADAIAATLE